MGQTSQPDNDPNQYKLNPNPEIPGRVQVELAGQVGIATHVTEATWRFEKKMQSKRNKYQIFGPIKKHRL